MNTIDLDSVRQYVNENIVDFHKRRIKSLEQLKLGDLLKKNPYLFKAKNIETAGELVSGLLEAFLSSSEEKLFGDFLEHLAVFIASQTCNGHKSAATGVDLEFFNNSIHFVVSIKSGTNWGNSSQQNDLENNLKEAVAKVKQSKIGINVQPVLGICYGKTKTIYVRGYIKVVGQNFWYLISENKNLYTDIVEPIGYRAKKHNADFIKEKSRVINRFTKSFIDEYCDEKGNINWVKIVEFNSGNYDLNEFIS
jgi:hypothetical protein